MKNVIDLAARRSAPQAEGDPPAVCAGCGGQWFELKSDHPDLPEHGALVLRSNGTVGGYAGVPHCVNCGRAWRGNVGR